MTWRAKLEQVHPNHGKVCPIPSRMQKRLGRGTMVIPAPVVVDEIMRSVRKGKLMTQSQLRRLLAERYGADSACPMTTGIFVRVAAEAAIEDAKAGRKRITPFWRTIKDDGSLNAKYPGGSLAQAAALRDEGFTIEPGKGKRPPRVAEFESHLIKA